MPFIPITQVPKVIEAAHGSTPLQKLPEELEAGTCPHIVTFTASLRDLAKKLWNTEPEVLKDTSKCLGLVRMPGGPSNNFYDEDTLFDLLSDYSERIGKYKALDTLASIIYDTLTERLRMVSGFSVDAWKFDLISGMGSDQVAQSMAGGITTAVKYIHGGAKLIDDLLPDGSAKDKKILFGELRSFFHYVATVHQFFESPIMLSMAEADEQEYNNLTDFPMTKFIADRFKVDYKDDVPTLLLDNVPLIYQMDNMSKQELKTPRYGCAAYLAEILKPFLIWSEEVIYRYHFSLLENRLAKEA